MNWYYDLGGQRQGPVPEAEIDRLLAAGTITTNTLVWCEGMENWTPLKDARPGVGAAPVAGADVPDGWIRCAATGRYFPPSQIVWLDGKAYSAEAKAGIVQGVMQGGELPSGDEALRTGPAWEQRAQLGLFKAIWETVKAVLLDPNQAFATMKRDGGLVTPYFYFFIGGVLGILSFLATMMLFLAPMIAPLIVAAQKQNGGPQLVGTGAIGVVVFLIYAVMLIGSISVAPFIYAGITHLCLMLVGGAKRPFETTFRTWCYAHGSGMFLMVVPVCGWAVSEIWAIVVSCIGLARAHEIPTGKAVLAVLLPIIACCVLWIGLEVFVAIRQVATH